MMRLIRRHASAVNAASSCRRQPFMATLTASLAIVFAEYRVQGVQGFVTSSTATLDFALCQAGAVDHAVCLSRVTAQRRSSALRPNLGAHRRRAPSRNSVKQGGILMALKDPKDFEEQEFDPNIYEEYEDSFEDDDMGMGVSNTVANKKRRPRPEDEEEENRIQELATAAQDIVDFMMPEEEQIEKGKKQGEKDDDNTSSSDDDVFEWIEDDDSGMGVSETVSPAPSNSDPDDPTDSSERAAAAMQGSDLVLEMKSSSARDMRRVDMEERGLSPEQIAAYMGDDLAVVTKSKKEEAEERALQKYNQAAFVDSMAWKDEEALLQVAPSSSLVKIDDNGDPYQDRFVYVDEYTCIGCTHCSHTAPSTFFMEDEYGRARVYQQGKDTDDAVRDAILTCPVDCIHYVDWPELKKLEVEREGLDINFKARLVGNDHDSIANGQQLISGNQGMRCENCPSRGCYNCPMFGVGNNPEYTKRKAERKLKREARLKKEEEDSLGQIRSVDL